MHVFPVTFIAEDMSFTGMQAMLAAMDEEFNHCYFKLNMKSANKTLISSDQSLQEMRESHGHRLRGFAERLRLTGKSGNIKGNIERDMHRRVGLEVCMLICMLNAST